MSAFVDSVATIAWMEEEGAVRFLMRDCAAALGEPEARSLWSAYAMRAAALTPSRAAVARRARQIGVSVPAAAALLRSVVGEDVTGVVAVDPRRLLAYQSVVAVTRAAEHAASPASWAERCLVTGRPQRALAVATEGNSLCFDVDHAEHVLRLSPDGVLAVRQMPGYTMVVPFEGRLLLKAGYHRAYAYMTARPRPREPFLAAMTLTIPPELLHESSLRAKLLSARPPLVGDFLRPELSMHAKTHRWPFRFRITAQMQALPWSEAAITATY